MEEKKKKNWWKNAMLVIGGAVLGVTAYKKCDAVKKAVDNVFKDNNKPERKYYYNYNSTRNIKGE